jgi:hypothetical protein
MPEQTTEKRAKTPGGLGAWIRTANHGLCAQAKERVSKEIRAHHAEAYAELCDSGFSPEAAYELAVEGLGDASAANNAFRKTYLTSWQERLLANLAQPVKPITAKDYGSLAFQVSVPPMLALWTVCLDYHLDLTNYPMWLSCNCVFFLFCLGWLAIVCSGVVHALYDSLRQWRGLLLHARPKATNRAYAWFLMACLVSLFLAWRIQFPFVSPAENRTYCIFLFLAGRTVTARAHRKAGVYFFGLPWPRAWARTGLLLSYALLLTVASLTCALWPPSWSVMTTFLILKPNPAYPFISSTDVYGMFGVMLAAILMIVAIRWLVGLYLLRKEISGRSPTETGPAYPETPFGE